MESPRPEPDSSIAARKAQWRERLKAVRAGLDPARRKEAASNAVDTLTNRLFETNTILSFASFSSEIDLWTFNRALSHQGKLILPYLAGQELLLFLVPSMDRLKRHQWGILEPDPSQCSPVDCSKVEVALIPGLGFDPKTRSRLGYGGGYYDKLIPKLRNAKAWGVGFKEQSVEGLPHEIHDQSLHEILLF
jgi:5-formyltetrahydrofolate cyclo-ligase